MAAHHPQLTRLQIPQESPSIPQALFTPGLPTAIQHSFHINTPLQANFGPQMPFAPPQGRHRSHASLIFPDPATALATAGITPPSGISMTPSGVPTTSGVLSSNVMLGGPGFQRNSRRTPSVSVGGPPKAPLGGPNRKVSPMALAVTAQNSTPAPGEKAKVKKVVVKLPIERILQDEEGVNNQTYSLWSRMPLKQPVNMSIFELTPPEILTIQPHPMELRGEFPATIDVFLPGKAAWEEYYQNIIEEKLERLGVERGGNSAPPGQSHLNGRAASVSSPADPALLHFKLNKLRQSQNGSVSTSPQLPSLSASPNPQMPPRFQQNSLPRHGHSFSMANYDPLSVFDPSNGFNPLVSPGAFGPDQMFERRVSPVTPLSGHPMHEMLPHLHAPQGLVPVSLNMRPESATASSGPSRVASTIPDFNRGFGLDIPEEDEEDLHAFNDAKPVSVEFERGAPSHGEQLDGKGDEAEDDATTAGAHTRHASKVSIALSLKSVSDQVQETIQETAPPELDQPVEWNLENRRYLSGEGRVDQENRLEHEYAAEWTGSEDGASLGEYSNPSDEARAIQARNEKRAGRVQQPSFVDTETPRHIPNFPQPPGGKHPHHPYPDDDIISNPSEEARLEDRNDLLRPGQYQTHQDIAYYQPVVDGQPRSPRPLPPLPHSRTASGQYSYPPSGQHSRHPSKINEAEVSMPTMGRDSLNPLAKPFVFGAIPLSVQVNHSVGVEAGATGHTRQKSLGRALNAAAAEFKPVFNFVVPPGVPHITFPASDVSRSLPPPSLGISPSRVQGREKRQRRESNASYSPKVEAEDDEDGQNTMSSFRFPPTLPVPSHVLHVEARPISPMPQRSRLNATARPFTFSGPSLLSNSHASAELPEASLPSNPEAESSDTQLKCEQETYFTSDIQKNEDTAGSMVPTAPSPSFAREQPPVLDFKHPISTTTVPAGLFKKTLISTDMDGSTRPSVRSRLGSREIFEHMNTLSLDDNIVPAISRRTNVRPCPATSPSQEHVAEGQPVVVSTPPIKNESLINERKPHVLENEAPSPISESKLSDYTRRRDKADQLEQRLQDMLDDRMELARKDLTDIRDHATKYMVAQVVDALKPHLSELVSLREIDTIDARGEVDFELIRNTLDQGVVDIRTGLRRDLEEVVELSNLARERSPTNLPANFQRIMEDFGNRTISAVTNAVVKFAARIDQIDDFARVRASDEREMLLTELCKVLAPSLESLRQPPIDFDLVTARLAEAVKPHITQLIDLTSDKKETAGLILQRLLPTLSTLSQTPAHVDIDAIVAHLRAELAQMAPASDMHVLKHAVADLVVERLDSRLALREKVLYSRISERIDDLHAPVSDVRKAVEELHTGQESIVDNSQALNRLHQDMSAKLLELPSTIDNAIGAILTTAAQLKDVQDASSGDISQLLPHLDSIEATVRNLSIKQESLVALSTDFVAFSEKLQSSVDALPDGLAEAVASIKETQNDILSKLQAPDPLAEVRNLLATNADLQVQLAKARGAHGQIRVEKDLMFDRMTNAESDKENLRQQLEDLKDKSATKETEVATAGIRITELEDALSHASARLESSDVIAKTKEDRIATLESQNREYSLEQYQLKSQIHKLELQEQWHIRDKANLEQRVAQLQKDRDDFATQQSHWQELRQTSEQVQQLTRLISAADSAEMAQLKAASDRAKILEGEHVSLQKRFKDQENKIANLERTSQATRQSVAQAQQRASEWEKRTKELETELEATRARLDEVEEAKLQADSDLSLVRMQLEEKEKAEQVSKGLEKKMEELVIALKKQVSDLSAEVRKSKAVNISAATPMAASPSPPRWASNGYDTGTNVRPASRASTVYGNQSPATPTKTSQRKPSLSSPGGIWDSIHAPSRRSVVVSPTPSTISLTPTQGDDGWWS